MWTKTQNPNPQELKTDEEEELDEKTGGFTSTT